MEKKHKETYSKTTFSGRSYLNYRKEILHELLNSYNWGAYYASSDIDTAWDILYTVILKFANKLCPVKTFHIKRDRPPWFSDEITELSKNRDELFKTGKLQKNQVLLNEASYLRNTLKRDITELKNDYFTQFMTTNQDNVNKFWTTMNEILCKNKNKAGITVIKDPDSQILLNPMDSMEVLNHYFVNIADVLVSKLPDSAYPQDNLITSNTSLKLDSCFTPNKIRCIDQMHRKAAYRLKLLQLVRESLTGYAALRMAKSMIIPFIDYGSLFLSSATDAQINKIQTLQNRILKLALKLPRLHSTRHLHRRAKELTFRHRIIVNQLKFIARNLAQEQSMFSLIQNSGIDIVTRSHTTRDLKLNTPLVAAYRKSFSYQGPLEWNKLPSSFKVSPSFPLSLVLNGRLKNTSLIYINQILYNTFLIYVILYFLCDNIYGVV